MPRRVKTAARAPCMPFAVRPNVKMLRPATQSERRRRILIHADANRGHRAKDQQSAASSYAPAQAVPSAMPAR